MPIDINQRFRRTGDSYLISDRDLRGGYRTVATIQERNNIALDARTLGMVVFVQADQKEYTLLANISNASWQVKSNLPVASYTTLYFFDDVRDYDEEDFEQQPIAALADWFNENNNTVSAIGAFFRIKIYQAESGTEKVQNTIPQADYVGEITVVYTSSPLISPVVPSAFGLLSKYVSPQGNSVVAALNKYSDAMEEQEANNG
mgnify:CR=1 FL=1